MKRKASPKTRIEPSEDQLQIYANDLLTALAIPGAYWHHSPNGGYRHPKIANQMKRFGTKAGFPDLFLMPPNRSHWWLELKTLNGYLSKQQKEFRAMVEARGDVYRIARTPEAIRHSMVELGMIKGD